MSDPSSFLEGFQQIVKQSNFEDKEFVSFVESQNSARKLLKRLVELEWVTSEEVETYIECLYDGLDRIAHGGAHHLSYEQKLEKRGMIFGSFEKLIRDMKQRESKNGCLKQEESFFDDDSDSEASDDTIKPANSSGKSQEVTEASGSTSTGDEQASDTDTEEASFIEQEHKKRTDALLEIMREGQQPHEQNKNYRRPSKILPFRMSPHVHRPLYDADGMLINPRMQGPPELPPNWRRG